MTIKPHKPRPMWANPKIPGAATAPSINRLMGDYTPATPASTRPGADDHKEIKSKATQPATCEHCDGTGDVHSEGGEWRGRCSCGIGKAKL